MSILSRTDEYVDTKKLLNVMKNYNDFKSDKYFDESKVISTMYEKQKRNKGYFTPMYYKPKIEGSRNYCKTGYGALTRKVRNYLADGIYLDIDMKNSVYNIFSSIASNNSLKHEAIDHYIFNREDYLSEVMTEKNIERDEAKEIFTAMCFTFIKNKDKIDKQSKLYPLQKEIKKIQLWLITNTPDLAKYKKNYKGDEYNYEGKVVSQIYFCIEWDILYRSINFLKEKEFEVCADLHDGFFVLINEEDDNYEENITNSLIELNNHIFEETNYKVEFIIKPMTDKIDLPDAMNILEQMQTEKHETYSKIKEEFEKSVAKIESSVKFVVEDDVDKTFKSLSRADLIIKYEDFYPSDKFALFTKTPVSFVRTWLLDDKKRKYRTMEFIFDVTKCPDDVYNVFKGFEIANYSESYKNEITEDDNKLLQIILDHIKFLCDDESNEANNMYEYVLNWIAHLFQKPTEKATTCLILKGYEGCGKGILFNMIRNMLGNQYGFTTANPMNDMFGNFNSSCANKLLINIDEIDSKQAKGIYEELKKFITDDTINYKQKFIDASEVANLSRVLITTNNDYNLMISESNRRFCLIECIHKKKPTDDTIDTLLNSKVAQMLFYRFLMKRNISDLKLESFPKSNLYKKALENSARPILDFLDSISDTSFSIYKGMQSTTISSMYEMYKSWCRDTTNFVLKRKDFKCELFQGNQVFKEIRTANSRLICWDRDDFVKYLVDNGFQEPPMFQPDSDDDEAFN
jgi:putative DNA primase/helicase